MRSKTARFLALILGFFTVSPVPARAEAVRLSPAEILLLSDTLAERCPDVPYAARVGMAAAVLGRMESPAYPDSLPDVLAGLEAEGAFGPDGRMENRPSGARGIGRALRRVFLSGVRTASGNSAESRLREISSDAVRAALAGGDPVSGALSFRYVPPPRTGDFLFDDSREDAYRQRLAAESDGCRAVIGGVGFR